MIDRGTSRSIAAWCAVTVVVRALWLARVPPVIAWDGIIYSRTALRIAHGMGFIDTWNNLPPWKPTAFYPVGYPALLGLGHALAGPSLWVAGVINVIAAVVVTACVVALSRRALGAHREHLPAALYALSPGAVMYASTLMTETVSGAILIAAVLVAERHARGGSARSAITAGLLLGFGGLVRPQTLLLAPVVALLSSPATPLGARARTLALVGLGACAMVLPWTARNCSRLDGCALVSVNGGSNLWIGADPEAGGGYRDLRPGEGCDRVRGEVAKDRCYGNLALRSIRTHPLRWVSLIPAKIHTLLSYEAAPAAYLRDGGALSPARARGLVLTITAYHRLVLALAMLATLAPRARRRSRAEWLCLGAVLGSVGVHCVFFGGDRYHFVFMPLVAVLAGAVIPPSTEKERA